LGSAAIERLRDVTARLLAIRDDSMARAKARLLEMGLAAAELDRMQAKFDTKSEEERTKLLELESRPTPVAERDFIRNKKTMRYSRASYTTLPCKLREPPKQSAFRGRD
jgi:hypothetical protein